MKRLAILGSTGSIGSQTLEVVRGFPERFEVVALACGSRIEQIEEQIREFHPLIASVASEEDALNLKKRLAQTGEKTAVFWGNEGNRLCAALPEAEMVVAAMVGVKGLDPVVAAIDAGKDIALANKETLIAGGSIVIPKFQAKFGKLL